MKRYRVRFYDHRGLCAVQYFFLRFNAERWIREYTELRENQFWEGRRNHQDHEFGWDLSKRAGTDPVKGVRWRYMDTCRIDWLEKRNREVHQTLKELRKREEARRKKTR